MCASDTPAASLRAAIYRWQTQCWPAPDRSNIEDSKLGVRSKAEISMFLEDPKLKNVCRLSKYSVLCGQQ